MKTLNGSIRASSILLVEDNYDDFELIEHQLGLFKESGLVIEYCDCLAAALTRVRRGGVDAVLLDLSLPDSQGIDTVVKMRNTAPAIPIIVLTGTVDNELALASLKYGAEDYLTKGSFDVGALCRSINYAIARSSAKEARERLAAIVEASDDAIISNSLNGTITSWNKGAAILLGYSEEEARGKSISMIIPPESTNELEHILKTISKGEIIHNLETVRISKSGVRIDVSATISPIFRDDGTISGAATIERDITQKKHAEKVLHESEERYRMLVAGVKDYAIFMLDVDGRVASWNDGAKRLKGYEASEIVGKHFSLFYTADDRRAGIPDAALRIAVEKGCFEILGLRVRKDETSFFADIVITPLFDIDGRLCGFTKIVRDVSERKHAEREISNATLRLRLALESGAIGVWDYDLATNSVWRSLRHDEIFGYSKPLPAWNFDTFISHVLPEDQAAAREGFQSGLERGQLRLQCRITRVDDKQIRWVSARGETF